MSARRIGGACCVLALVLCLGACKGIGRPLIDHRKTGMGKGQEGLCVLAPSCDDDRVDDVNALVAPLDTTAVDLDACGLRWRSCPAAPFPADPLVDPPPVGTCVAGWTARQAQTETVHRTFECAALRIEIDPDYDASLPVQVSVADLRHTNLWLSSVRPATVELDSASLNDVHIEVQGPITLRITHPRMLTHVRITNTAGDDTAAQLELENADGDDLSVSGPARFNGRVSLKSSNLMSARITADDIALDDTALTASSLGSSTFDGRHATLDSTTLAFEYGRLEASSGQGSQVTDCRTLDVITGMFTNMRFAVCRDAPLRFYGASAEKVFFDGQIQADHSLFENVLFGAHEQTDLVAWDSQVFTSNFCRHSRTARLGASVFVLCPSCDPEANLIACVAASSTRKIESTQCEPFVSPLACGNALPDRPKPPG